MLAKDIEVEIAQSDISTSHRLRGRAGRAKPIIVKFVRRDTKIAIMKNKKRLRSTEIHNSVYIDEDLTPMRGKILRELKKDGRKAWSVDGIIYCIVRESGQDVKAIDSPKDLIKVGWNEGKVIQLRLYFKF